MPNEGLSMFARKTIVPVAVAAIAFGLAMPNAHAAALSDAGDRSRWVWEDLKAEEVDVGYLQTDLRRAKECDDAIAAAKRLGAKPGDEVPSEEGFPRRSRPSGQRHGLLVHVVRRRRARVQPV